MLENFVELHRRKFVKVVLDFQVGTVSCEACRKALYSRQAGVSLISIATSQASHPAS